MDSKKNWHPQASIYAGYLFEQSQLPTPILFLQFVNAVSQIVNVLLDVMNRFHVVSHGRHVTFHVAHLSSTTPEEGNSLPSFMKNRHKKSATKWRKSFCSADLILTRLDRSGQFLQLRADLAEGRANNGCHFQGCLQLNGVRMATVIIVIAFALLLLLL